jgi:hypothetical protein
MIMNPMMRDTELMDMADPDVHKTHFTVKSYDFTQLNNNSPKYKFQHFTKGNSPASRKTTMTPATPLRPVNSGG